MKKFNVRDRDLPVHRHYLLEASAGTGKTFSIQNIVVRLLIEPDSAGETRDIQNILVVTFTRAATRDLRMRIRSDIERAIDFLETASRVGFAEEAAPDYLKARIEKGEESIRSACKLLRRALFTYDQAQIFTIHSFCAKMLSRFALESDTAFVRSSGEDPLPETELMEVIGDFFRTEIRPDEFSPAQLDVILRGDPDQRKLLNALRTPHEFPVLPSFKELYLQWVSRSAELKNAFSLTAEKMIEDFQAQASSYKNRRSGISKTDDLENVRCFAAIFDRTEPTERDFDRCIRVSLVWVEALDPKLRKQKGTKESPLHYPGLTGELKRKLQPIIERARDFSCLLLRSASICRKQLLRYQSEEEKFGPDDILRKMHRALARSNFLLPVQSNYTAAVIDEFQDTDPIQWEIFRNLFLSRDYPWMGSLYLVGDPKQSIYSFRQADIYTYLSAVEELGEDRCFSLDINFRSQASLVEALNTLFSPAFLSELIPLPKKSVCLPYRSVESSGMVPEEDFADEKGAVHFCVADAGAFKKAKLTDLEEAVFFPFIGSEIIRLKRDKSFGFRRFAVLVRDRYQASRLARFFDRIKIPYVNQRPASLIDSDALQGWIDLMQAILKPYDTGALLNASGSFILGMTHEELKRPENVEASRNVVARARTTLFEKGFAPFFRELLDSRSKPGCDLTVREQILLREGGKEFFRDLQQIADTIIAGRLIEWHTPEGIIPFLDRLRLWEQNDDPRVKRFQDPEAEGVNILSLHVSKGLEFDVVFALGLVNRTSGKENFFPVEIEGKSILTPIAFAPEAYDRFCEENDAEKMRQLYVALTRAKHRVYIPVALHLCSDPVEKGEASPIELLLARLYREKGKGPPVNTYEKLYERIRNETGEDLIAFLQTEEAKKTTSYSLHREPVPEPFPCPTPVEVLPIYRPKRVDILHEPFLMTSFSALNGKREIEFPSSEIFAENPDVLSAAPSDYAASRKSVHTLPANSDTGLLVHSLLENLHFKDFKRISGAEQAVPLVRPFLTNTPFTEWEETISELIFNTLKTPLFSDGSDAFCLEDSDSDCLFREMPFLYPYRPKSVSEELLLEKGMIKGVLDLLVYRSGRYYLVDWKTNWLGIDSDSYRSDSMHRAMEENGYYLQASIYTEAIRRYLKVIDKRPFEECFGGVYYLFLRGMNPDRQTGIFPFSRKKVQKYKNHGG